MIVVAATQNNHKIMEIEAITKEFGMEIISRKEAGVPEFEIEETGDTFEENSEIKAVAIMNYCKQISIADDSGLMVDALDGAPGVISARFAGEDANDEENNQKLLACLAGETNRSAKFVSVITMVSPNGEKISARGECFGKIIDSPRGNNGFGYDPLFVPEGYDKTFGELSAEEKNKISHRAKALQVLKDELERLGYKLKLK